jgi:hypothetical protein
MQGANTDIQQSSFGTWLPICIAGVQHYVREVFSAGVTTKEYKQGANGTISTTAPAGILAGAEGYCQIDTLKADLLAKLQLILVETQAVNANTDTVEAKLQTLITDQLAGNATLTSIKNVLSNDVLPQLIAINANTDNVETLITQTNTTLTSLLNELDYEETVSTPIEGCLNGTEPIWIRTRRIYDSESGTLISETTEFAINGTDGAWTNCAGQNTVIGACKLTENYSRELWIILNANKRIADIDNGIHLDNRKYSSLCINNLSSFDSAGDYRPFRNQLPANITVIRFEVVFQDLNGNQTNEVFVCPPGNKVIQVAGKYIYSVREIAVVENAEADITGGASLGTPHIIKVADLKFGAPPSSNINILFTFNLSVQ